MLLLAGLARILAPRPSGAALERLARADRGPRPISKRPPIASLDHARAALAERRLAEALYLFGEILEADPKSAWAWHGRGDALQLLGQPEDALAAYTKASTLAPQQGLHHGGRANALAALGRTDDAADAWAMALKLDPSLTWMRDGRPAPG